jgi:hypothetical protein
VSGRSKVARYYQSGVYRRRLSRRLWLLRQVAHFERQIRLDDPNQDYRVGVAYARLQRAWRARERARAITG